ncbi:venom protease-like [Lycorma delicatula]|uniref:venom protease-like n=1 Tax=Lycorma delicatula TaxID=130591 RepID=UPI003F5154E1
MISSFPVVFILFYILSCFLRSSSSHNLKENDFCATDGARCLKFKNCTYFKNLDIKLKASQLPFCGYDGVHPLFCCTKNLHALYGSVRELTKSAEMCSTYQFRICGKKYDRHIGGGTPAEPKELPFMALVGYGNKNDISWRCGGSIISTRYILSAAHCSETEDMGSAKWIRVGDLDTSTDKEDAKPQDFYIVTRYNHPEYHPPAKYNDIALYKVNKEIEFNQYVRPVCLHQYTSILTHKNIMAAGWGRLGFVGPQSSKLMKVELNLLPHNDCEKSTNKKELSEGIHLRSMLCVGYKKGERDTCPGDSGGPAYLPPSTLQLKRECFLYTQIGITSFGYQCGLPDYPGVYTNVANYLRWIEKIVWPDDTSDSPTIVWT